MDFSDDEYLFETKDDESTAPDYESPLDASQYPTTESHCPHSNQTFYEGVHICEDCGLEIGEISYLPEWKSKRCGDAARCHKRTTKGVSTELLLRGVREDIANEVEKIYLKVTESKIHRGIVRQSLIAGSMFCVLRTMKEPATPEQISKIIGVRKSEVSKGVSIINRVIPEERTKIIRIEDWIPSIGKELISQEEIQKIVKFVKETDFSKIKSEPRSIAAIIIHLHYQEKIKLEEIIKVTVSVKQTLSVVKDLLFKI